MEGTTVVITKKARENLCKARAGAITIPTVEGMAFGTGGIDSEGKVISLTDDQERLKNEIYRKAIDSYSFPEETTCRYECTLDISECQGETISEIGLYDTNGDIVAIKNFTAKGKDSDIEMTFVLDDIF